MLSKETIIFYYFRNLQMTYEYSTLFQVLSQFLSVTMAWFVPASTEAGTLCWIPNIWHSMTRGATQPKRKPQILSPFQYPLTNVELYARYVVHFCCISYGKCFPVEHTNWKYNINWYCWFSTFRYFKYWLSPISAVNENRFPFDITVSQN